MNKINDGILKKELISAFVKLPESRKDDITDIIVDVLLNPGRNPFQKSMNNPAYYAPLIQHLATLIALHGKAMENIPHIGEKP
jgi:hypothetical protein